MPAPIFAPGDKVYLDASDIQTTRPSKKLAHRQLGPYIVECQVGSHAYRLQLPKYMSQLHPVFLVIMLRHHPHQSCLMVKNISKLNKCWIVACKGADCSSSSNGRDTVMRRIPGRMKVMSMLQTLSLSSIIHILGLQGVFAPQHD